MNDRRVWQRGNDAVPVRRDHAPGAELPQTARFDDNVHLNVVWSPDKTLKMYPGSYHSLHRGIGKEGVWADPRVVDGCSHWERTVRTKLRLADPQ